MKNACSFQNLLSYSGPLLGLFIVSIQRKKGKNRGKSSYDGKTKSNTVFPYVNTSLRVEKKNTIFHGNLILRNFLSAKISSFKVHKYMSYFKISF